MLTTAEVQPHFFIFRFFKKGLHIGPCYTTPEERGHGYYPFLLNAIAQLHPKEDLYMMVRDTNTASIHGVKKAGFRPFAEGRKTWLNLYVATKYYSSVETSD